MKTHTDRDTYAELEQAVSTALETYSNVHRGSGHYSMVSTHLYEYARTIVLEYLGLDKSRYMVIFCSPRGADLVKSKLKPDRFHIVSSQDIGLPLGVRAFAAERKALPKGILFQTGGGTTALISPDWIIWANAPEKFEAGTPPIINIIAFARALQLIKQSGSDIFHHTAAEKLSAGDILYNDELKEYSGQELLDKLRQTIIGNNILVPTEDGLKPYINFDKSASTPTFIPVWNAVRQTWKQPLQIHREIVNEVRSICNRAFGAPETDYDVIFTSNTTEAINLATESLSQILDEGIEPVILSTILEHSSNDLPWRMIPQFSMLRLQIDDGGFLKLDELESTLSEYNQERRHGNKRIRLMAVSGASNVLGSYNDLAEISRIVHKYEARLLVDGAQLVAHRKVDIGQLGIDYLALSAHKLYAPFGTGVLIVRKGLLNFNSAELEHIKASGDENASGIAALGKALVLLQRIGFEAIREDEHALTRKTLLGLSKMDAITIYGVSDPASPNFQNRGGVIVFTMKGLMSEQVAKELSMQGGIGVRCGCHCAHILVKHILSVSPGLERFQRIIFSLFPNLRAPGVVRVSLGIGNTGEEVDTLIHVLGKIAGKSRASGETKQKIKDFVKAAKQRVYM